MDTIITIPECICGDEVVDYIVTRYSITLQQVISHFLYQAGIMEETTPDDKINLCFEENEMAILRDMGICPSRVEFIDKTI